MLTYNGSFVGIEYGAPTLGDIAIGLGRTARFRGQLKVYYSVLAHSLVVAYLAPEEARLHALLHDAAESVVGDMPTTLKTEADKYRERRVLYRIYARLGLDWPHPDIVAMVKKADNRALRAEAWALGVPDLVLHSEFHPRDEKAERCVAYVLSTYDRYEDYLEPNGSMVQDYLQWVRWLLGHEAEGHPGQGEFRFEEGT